MASRGAVRLEILGDGDEPEFIYEVRNRAHPLPATASGAVDATAGDTFHRAEVHLSEGGQDYCIMGWTREQIAMDVYQQYSAHVHFKQTVGQG